MSRTFILTIGGTGCRIMKSLVFLAAMDFDSFKNKTVIPIVLDSDIKNPAYIDLSRIIKQYSSIASCATKKQTRGYFQNKFEPISLINPKDLFPKNIDDEYNLLSCLNIDPNEKGNSLDLDLLKLLYHSDSSNEKAGELEMNIEEGFYGSPNIGSAIFSSFDTKVESLLKLDEYGFQAKDNIILVGSIFGGMGASGIPFLINLIRKSDNESIKKANVSAVLGLPYFILKSDENKKGDEIIDSYFFKSKAKSALNYYYNSDVIDKFDRVFFFGENESKSIYENHPGGEKQSNPSHHIELLAARAILMASNSDNSGSSSEYEFTRKELAKDNSLLTLSEFESIEDHDFWSSFSTFGLFVKYLQFITLKQHIDREALANSKKYAKKIFVAYKEKANNNIAQLITKEPVFKNLYNEESGDNVGFLQHYLNWIMEMGANEHLIKFKPFLFESEKLNEFFNGIETNNLDPVKGRFGTSDILVTELNKVISKLEINEEYEIEDRIQVLLNLFSKVFRNRYHKTKTK